MAGFFARLFSPALRELQQKNRVLADEVDFWCDRYHDERKARVEAESKLEQETKTNRTREDLLLNAALHAAGSDGIPIRDVLETPDTSDTDELPPGVPEDDDVLRDRAQQIAEQKFQDPTEDQVEEIYEDMKKNPAYWLSN